MKVFFDADVVFSAIYSREGAARALVSSNQLQKYTSEICLREVGIALARYGKVIDPLVIEELEVLDISSLLIQNYEKFVFDQMDAHVVAAAASVGANLLTSYNIKDYDILRIENDLDIQVKRPAEILFYLRQIG